MSEWKDISTAPKDGSVVLGWWPSMAHTGGYMQSVKFDDFRQAWLVYWDLSEVPVTYWMPLPPPPNPHSEKVE